ncbi:MAG: response regulator transcription factor [Pedosphaera sp.]|nr:response regulator transcription factor [Pedosphaera sp.]
MSTKIVLVDDHHLLRDGLKMVLRRDPGMEVVGEASNLVEALECVRRVKPDLVLMDVHLPDGNGISIVRSILNEVPQARILMLSGDSDLAHVHEAMKAGVSGYLLKEDTNQEVILTAVRSVLNNNTYLSPTVTTALVENLRANRPAVAPTAQRPLSKLEIEVLQLIAEGLRNKEMAIRMGVSVKSVETYRARLMKKVNCASTAELVRYALREGLMSWVSDLPSAPTG